MVPSALEVNREVNMVGKRGLNIGVNESIFVLCGMVCQKPPPMEPHFKSVVTNIPPVCSTLGAAEGPPDDPFTLLLFNQVYCHCGSIG